MERQRNTQTVIIAILAVALLIMSVGYAGYTEQLQMTGTVKVKPATWKVQFKDGSYSEAAGSVAATAHTLDATTMTYSVTLEKPGDVYEFNTVIENTGTFDANLTAVTMTELNEAQSKYLTYEITYGSRTFTESETGLNISLPKNNTAPVTVKVKVAYTLPADEAELPQTEQTITLQATFDYEQA